MLDFHDHIARHHLFIGQRLFDTIDWRAGHLAAQKGEPCFGGAGEKTSFEI